MGRALLICINPHTRIVSADYIPEITGNGATVVTHSSGGTLDSYLAEAIDGCIVLDKTPVYEAVSFSDFASFVCACPIFDILMKPWTVRTHHDADAVRFPRNNAEMIFSATLTEMAAFLKEHGGWAVSVDAYVSIWKSVGARVGHVRNHSITWYSR